MKTKRIKISKTSIFYIAWIIMVIHMCVANSDLQEYGTPLISYFALLLFGIKMIIQKTYKWREIVLIIFACLWGYFSYRATDDMRVLWFVIVLSASKGINFDKAVKYNFRTMLICCICIIGICSSGIIEETVMHSVRGIRHSFGLGHPNMCAGYYTLLMIQYIYLKFNTIKIKNLGILAIGSFFVYYFTKSTTGIVTAVATLLIVCILKYFPLKKINMKVITLGLIIGIIIFTVIPIIYDNRFYFIDVLMTGRLHQANFYYKKYGISFLGNNVNADLNSIYTDNILDMGYAKMLINNGLIYYTCVVLGYVLTMKKACEQKKRNLIALISCFIVYLLTENVATYIFMNVSMLLFTDFIYGNKDKKKGILRYGKGNP